MEHRHAVSREALLDAAERVALRGQGVRLTIDAVAEEANISKGGLLHHFPSKNRLIEELLERVAARWQRHLLEAYEKAPPGRNRMARALLLSVFFDHSFWKSPLAHGFQIIFATLANPEVSPKAFIKVRELMFHTLQQDGLCEGVPELLMATLDGVLMNHALHLDATDQQTLNRLRSGLSKLIEPVWTGDQSDLIPS